MNMVRAWDVFVAEASQLGASKALVEKARHVFEPALRAALLDKEAMTPSPPMPIEVGDATEVVVPNRRGRYEEARRARDQAFDLADKGAGVRRISKLVNRSASWVHATLDRRRKASAQA